MARILIAEDSPTQAERLRAILEGAGHAVEHAESAEKAAAIAERERFDLVISDVVMTGNTGYDLCRQIKAGGESRNTPVILLTSLDDPMAIIEGLACGADNFLTKPYEAAEILQRAGKLLENRALRDENKIRLGVDIAFLGKRFTITSDKEQIVDLLISTFEDVVRANTELQVSRAELAAAKADLENRVKQRTQELSASNARLERSLADLRESESRFRSIANTMPALLWMSDEAGNCSFVNQRWLDYTGHTEAKARNDGFTEPIHADQIKDVLAARRKYIADRTSNAAEYQLVGKDGTSRWFLDTAEPRLADDGRYLGHVGVLIDIDEHRQLEAQLRQSQKMEAIGQLTGGLAHDFNNLLTIIIGYAETLEVSNTLSAQDKQNVSLIEGAATRASELTRRLLAFSRRQALSPSKVEPNKLIGDIFPLLKRTIGESVEIECLLADRLTNIFVDSAQLESAIINLAVNARDAMPQGGKITVETDGVHLDEDYCAVNVGVQPGHYVLISVTDTGTGMSPEVQARVFEPFFTTKEVGKGTGLGLSMVYGFVKQSNGHIKIYSEVGHGTAIKIYLPTMGQEQEATHAAPVARKGDLPTGSEAILVVEDDQFVREYVVTQLKALGYQVSQAENGPLALKQIENTRKIDLLLTDMVMPGGLTGRQLAEKARMQRGDLRVLFMSGYPENSAIRQGRLEPGIDLLGKPFGKQVLATRVRAALDRAEK